ncbi:MAG TPA: pilus assembly protein N-terminal domain-containing protein [Caulobacterales bacterium]|nr:pilus assembly protein N-terminal domain-containing protein [Caulobacterales bacterium]
MHAEKWLNRAAGLSAWFAAAFIVLVASMSVAHADGSDGLRGVAYAPAPRPEGINISLDQAFPIHLAAPAEGIAVGNPAIAGVSVQNDRLLFVTGRSYGSTNLVIVGAGGHTLYSGRVTVSPDETGVVMVTRGVESARLECTPLCRPRADIGEAASTFSATTDQVNGRVQQPQSH